MCNKTNAGLIYLSVESACAESQRKLVLFFFSKMLSKGAMQPFENGTIQFSFGGKSIYGISMISDRM